MITQYFNPNLYICNSKKKLIFHNNNKIIHSKKTRFPLKLLKLIKKVQMDGPIHKGKGAQINPANKYLSISYEPDPEFYDTHEFKESGFDNKVNYINVYPKTIVNRVNSPDVGMGWSLNPYQGCEHGCIYCYARNSHEYWGYSAGKEFESNILVKPNAPELLEKFLRNPKWKAKPIILSGNTDCYQPIERKLKITRELLMLFLKYQHPVGIITKNALIIRDLDILTELAKKRLIKVSVSINSLNEVLRRKMEPRTVNCKGRLKVIARLSQSGIPVGIMNAPVIPGLNDHEIPAVIKAAAENGASDAGYTVVRLNGAISEIFSNWLDVHFPDRKQKVLSAIASCHNGNLNDSRWGERIKGSGNIADIISQLFIVNRNKYMKDKHKVKYNLSLFRNEKGIQLGLFEDERMS